MAANGRVYVGTSRGVVALDAAHGNELWHLATAGIAFSPVLTGGIALVATRAGTVHALRAVDGERVWERRLAGWVYPPAVAGDLAVVGGRAATLWALDIKDGTVRWERRLAQEPVYRAVAHGGQVLVSLFDGRLLSLSAADGQVRWQARNPVASHSPTVVGGTVVLPGLDGVLRAYAASDGRRLWSTRVGEGAPWSPRAVAGGSKLLTGDRGGNIALVDTASGELLWHESVAGGIVAAPVPVDGGVAVFPGKGRPPTILARPGARPPRYSKTNFHHHHHRGGNS